MTFQKILIPTDFSEFSLAAIAPALELAECTGGRLELLFVLEDLPSVPLVTFEHFGGGSAERFYEESQVRADETLQKTLEEKVPSERRGETHLRRGPAAHTIVETAAELAVDLVVMTTHGRSGLQNALLGSVTERVVRSSPCPVLTIRNRGGEP